MSEGIKALPSLFEKPAFFNFWALTLVLKLLLAILIPLSADEAYYWVWARNLQWSYYDHPPLVGWLFSVGSFFDGWGQLVRFPFVILGHLTLWVWLKILEPALSPRELKYWLGLALLSPLIGIGSLIGTPDVPLVFFWSLSLYYFIRCLHSKNFLDYLLFGACLGLGFLSKYHIVIFVPLALVALGLNSRWRDVRWTYVLGTAIAGLVFCLPVLYWNYANEWISFAFQLNHGLGEAETNLRWPVEYVLGIVAVIFPTVLYAAFLRNRSTPFLTLMHVFAWGPLLFFLFTSFRGSVELNWPIVALPPLFVLAVIPLERTERLLRWAFGFWVLGLGVVVAAFFVVSQTPYGKYFERIQEITDLTLLQDLPAKYSPLYASTYQMASKMWYDTKTPIYKLKGIGRIDFYDFQAEATPQSLPFYIIIKQTDRLPSWLRDSYQTEPVEVVGKYQVVKVSEL